MEKTTKICNNQVGTMGTGCSGGQLWPRWPEIIFILLSLLNTIIILPTLQAPIESKAFIKVTKFQVPSQAKSGDTLHLACYYELSEGQRLYALQLFKDGNEFYRHTPKGNLHFRVDGILMESIHSNPLEIILRNVSPQTAGKYRCTIRVDDTFDSISQEKELKVVARPNQTPMQQLSTMADNVGIVGGAGAMATLGNRQQQQRHAVHLRKQQQLFQQQQKLNNRGHIAPSPSSTGPVHEGQHQTSASSSTSSSACSHSKTSLGTIQLVVMYITLTLITSIINLSSATSINTNQF